MSVNITPHIEHLETEEEYAQSFIDDVELTLFALLEQVPTFSAEEWNQIFTGYNTNSLIEIKDSQKQKIFKVASVDLLVNLAKKNNWQLAKDSNHLYLYNSQCWLQVKEDVIYNFLDNAAVKMGIPRWIGSDETFVNHLRKQLGLKGFFTPMVQSHSTYLNLQNGTLSIDKNGVELIPHNPDHFLTHQLDFCYDPKSTNELWLQFLDSVLPDKDTQKTLQQSLGYLFIRDLKLEKAIFLYGTGSNGKSVVFEVLKGLVSSKMMTSYSLQQLTSDHGYHLERINNKLINYGTDISLKKINTSTFKSLVSGEPQGVRQIREQSYTMTNYAKFIFNINKLEDADTETTHGFFRRMIFIPFEQTIAKEDQDKELHHKILENKAGVLNWIIEGIQDVVSNQSIYESPRCENFLDSFKRETNPVNLFIEEIKLKPTPTEDNIVISQQLVYDMYKVFCKRAGEKPLSKLKLKGELKALEFEETRRNSGRVWFAQIEQTDTLNHFFRV
jgi:putative DNA primase/helicase